MPAHQFNVIFKQIVEREVNRIVDADDEASALELAKQMLRDGDGVSEVIIQEIVERNMMLDDEGFDTETARIAESHSRLPNG